MARARAFEEAVNRQRTIEQESPLGDKMHNLPISKDAFFWALSITSQLHCIPLPSSVVMRRQQPPYTLGTLRLIAAQRGLKVRRRTFPSSQIDQLPLPCLVAVHVAGRARVTAN